MKERINRRRASASKRSALSAFCLLAMLQSAGADDSFPARYVIGDDQRQEKYDENKHGVVQAVALHFNQGWYVGLGVGATMLDPEGQSGGFSTNDDSDSGAKLMIGQQFYPHWSWEYAYLDAGEAGLGNTNPAIADESISYKIHSLFANYSLFDPNKDFNLLGKLGVSSISNSASNSNVNFDKQTSAQLAVGIAAQWRFTERWFLRVEHDRYDRDANYTGISLGLFLGGKNELKAAPISGSNPAPTAETEPEVAIAAPEPVPAVVTPPPEVCRQFNGVLEGLNFATGSAELNNKTRAILDKTIGTLREYPDVKVMVQAHTDSQGDAAYNKALSILRAQAVVDYITKANIEQSRIDAKGFGELVPIASNNTAAGRAKNRRVEFKTTDGTVCN